MADVAECIAKLRTAGKISGKIADEALEFYKSSRAQYSRQIGPASASAALRQASKRSASSLLCGDATMSSCPAGTSRTVSPPRASGPHSALCRSELPALLNIVM